MFNLLTKWFGKTKAPDGKDIISGECCAIHGDEPCDCRVDASRRNFMKGLVAGAIGVATGALVLPKKTIVTVPNFYPITNGSLLERSFLRLLQQPLYDTEILGDLENVSEVTYFQSPIEGPSLDERLKTYKFDLGRKALKIKPGETFSIKLTLPAPKLHLAGLKWESKDQSLGNGYSRVDPSRIPAGFGFEGLVKKMLS